MDFIPRSDAELLAWAKANSAVISGNPTGYFLTPAIATAYADLVSEFEQAYYASKTENAGKNDRIKRNQVRKNLVAYARQWARLVQGQFTVTIEQRDQLGISLRDNPGTPINAPTVRPQLSILSADGRLFQMVVKRIDTTGKAKLAGTIGANIFSWVGPTPDPDHAKWEWHGLVSRGRFFLEVGLNVPANSQIWFAAAWATARGLNGPLSVPVSAYVSGAQGTTAPAMLPTAQPEAGLLKAA